ncbi:HIRAN domain-containing protein [Tepidimonas aquatica]|uniref:HIRAN domain protein n=1 Tax=Tepidimonas aquatica TaxID=247482 RepID=A0A554WW67_9BURK|nr:HIRAN domain-containing protein [Tepidimonas aquatica]TSE27811.1 HIRAN domain protein [Tepidimonas aquatica]
MEDFVANISAVVSPAPGCAAPSIRARLWLPGYAFAPEDRFFRLWLLLADGRVLALRLPYGAQPDDALIAPIVAALADDLRGARWEVEIAGLGPVAVLYAAPVLPLPSRTHAGFVFDADYQRFVTQLDAEVMRLLLWLERAPTPSAVAPGPGEAPHPVPFRFLVSVRNYNRLATLPPVLRERRMQALRRFPALVAPILLTFHHSPNVQGGKRHAWREKDEAMEAVIDQGRDLTGALAQHYGISRGLVRAPVNTLLWPAPSHVARRGYLAMLDALPANQRPDVVEFERWQLYLANYFALLGETERGDPLPQPPAVHRGAFRLGWTRTWETAARRYGNLHPALADCRDFLAAVRNRAAALLRRPYGPSSGRLTAGWLACHGLLGLLEASQRWHRYQPARDPRWRVPEGFRLPAILGEYTADGHSARELLTPQALAEEGAAMHHCVANYWPEVVNGDRLFALQLSDGERATAQYAVDPPYAPDEGTRYELVQLRGPFNRQVSRAMQAWAARILTELNAPQRADARAQAYDASLALNHVWRDARQEAAVLDAKTERQLAAVLAWFGTTPVPQDVILADFIAGFQYHEGPKLEDELAPGQPLDLVREPDNPHDRQAVRIDWHDHKLGYVPRRKNADIAARLARGERLQARIIAVDRAADPWARVEFVVQAATVTPEVEHATA